MRNETDGGPDGLTRRGLLRCGAWAGAGVLWTLQAGVPVAGLMGAAQARPRTRLPGASRGVSFIQLSDSHIGFNRPANPDPAATLAAAVAQIRALPVQPDFILHTGDITHLSTAQQFDDAKAILDTLRLPIHFIPGEHDTQDEGGGRVFLDHFGQGTRGDGWYSFDAGGAHFIALVNVVHLQPGGLGGLGPEQIAWLQGDVAPLPASTPIVVFAHMPMWSVYPQWGWGTADAAQALSLLRRFGSVTVLNGHIHQIQQRVEGNVTFHTARSTAYPQPAPGAAPSPGPLTVPSAQLRSMLGVTSVRTIAGHAALALTDTTLATA